MASTGWCSHEIVVAIGTLTKWLMRLAGQQQAWCAVCYYGDSKKDKHLLADLIIDKERYSASPIRIDTIPISSESRHVRRWFAYVIVNKANERVGADEMCGGENTDINLTVESSGMLRELKT